MASVLTLLLYAVVGPFAILKLYAKNLMRQAYGNQVPLKIAASIISLAVGSQITYVYRSKHSLICLASGLFTLLINYWYVIPILLIYILPKITSLIKSWLSLIELFANQIIRPTSTRLRQLLPSTWTFDPNETFWPIETIHFLLTYGSIGPALYCGYEIYSRLCFGIVFNLCIAISITIVLTTTLWQLLDAIDRVLYPFIFAIIIQYYIIPVRSTWNIPMTLLLTTFLFPRINTLVTNNSIEDFIQMIKFWNYETLSEENQDYKQFFSEFVNLFLTIYLTCRILIISINSQVPWLLIISMMIFLPAYFYIKFIRFVYLEPSTTMFLLSSCLLGEYILNYRPNDHFIYKYFLVIMILAFYYALIYPIIYHTIRWLTQGSAHRVHMQLKSFREYIHRLAREFNEQYLHITYTHDTSRYFILHLSNVFIAAYFLFFLPINVLLRIILSLLSYLLLGRLLLTRGIELLAILIALSTSVTAGADVYARYDNSILITMSIAL
ncbi:unnamed protein product, partial [Adineta ricciae]